MSNYEEDDRPRQEAPKPFSALNGVHFSSIPPAKKWVIERLVPEGETVLWGQHSASKSFVALSMAGAIITGEPWLGRFPVQPGVVVYLGREGDIEPRWFALRKHLGIAYASDMEKEKLREEFHQGDDAYEAVKAARPDRDCTQAEHERFLQLDLVDNQNYEQALRARFPIAAKFIMFNNPISLTDDTDRRRVILGIQHELALFGKNVPALRLIIVDTVSRVIGEVDENTQMGMQALVRGVEHLRRQFCPLPSVLFLHHATGSNTNKMRGSKAFADDLDAHLKLEIIGNVSPKATLVPLLLTNEKAREGQAIDKVWLTKRELVLIDSGQEAAVLADENRYREAAGLPPLDTLGPRTSCVIEETTGSADVAATGQPAAPRAHAHKPARLGKNAQALVAALLAQPGKSFESESAWRRASTVPSGSFYKAKEEIYAANLAVPENGGVRLVEPGIIMAA